MTHTVIITKNERKNEFHIMYNGGFAYSFDAEIFSIGQIFRFAQKTYEPFAKDGDLVNIIVDENIPTPVCKKCGSTDVEIKAFVNQETGKIDYSSYEVSDTWCNDCQDHTGIK